MILSIKLSRVKIDSKAQTHIHIQTCKQYIERQIQYTFLNLELPSGRCWNICPHKSKSHITKTYVIYQPIAKAFAPSCFHFYQLSGKSAAMKKQSMGEMCQKKASFFSCGGGLKKQLPGAEQ